MATAGNPLNRANRLATRIDRRQAAGKQTGQAERKLGRINVGDAQLGYAMNSNDPRMQAQAKAQLQRQIHRDPASLEQYRAKAGAMKNPGAGNTGAVQNTMKPTTPGGGQTTLGPTQPQPQSGQGPTFDQALGTSFGSNNPFGVRELGGGNPLETAQLAAQRMLDGNLANTRTRFGAMGLGNSDRAALAEGQAIADMSTFLGDKMANIGENAYQNDANRGLSAILGAGQLDQGQQQIALAMNQMLSGLGTGLTGIGSQETGIPNLGEIMGILGMFSRTDGSGTSKGSGAQGFGWKR